MCAARTWAPGLADLLAFETREKTGSGQVLLILSSGRLLPGGVALTPAVDSVARSEAGLVLRFSLFFLFVDRCPSGGLGWARIAPVGAGSL